MRLPSRRGLVPSFIVMDMMREANRLEQAGRDVIHLEVGQPASGAPAPVRAAARASLESDPLGYTDAVGIPALRERIAGHYCARYGIAIEPERIVVTTGSSGAFVLTFLASFDPGARVVTTLPGYPSYRHILTALDIEPVLVAAEEADRFQPTPALMDRVSGRIDGLIVASPANPTGSMLSHQELGALAEACRARGALMISDELYHGIEFGTKAATILALADDMVAIGGFSKYHAMTGWRLGWVVLPPSLVRAVECLAQNLTVAPPTLAQRAAMTAFDCTHLLDSNVQRYAANRSLLVSRLPGLGLSRFVVPEGAFYLYASVGHLTNDSLAFCRRLLEETGVALVPGIDFDPVEGRHWVRLSFAGATEAIAEALQRLAGWPGLRAPAFPSGTTGP